ncbi:uncharacterized protein LOC111687111 [Lucilia cuprina]|uniref:uncharacterized protein LOC111687111 n=1 Tax=Lucilia cuprina TaxID=7375 RepID=UPI001F065E6A|nr:uncharacterized protein LOC111687111 [Lucilia cuprina]
MTFNMLRIIWCLSLLLVLNNLTLQCVSYPATSTDATTHIVSYVHQRKIQKEQQKKVSEFDEFDFENFRSNLTSKDYPEMRGALQQLFGRFVENFETNLDQLENVVPKNGNYKESVKDNEISYSSTSDDLMNDQMNTLDNGFGDNEQHESPKNETMWQRSKQSIPVLESVRHLVNSVRDGHLNHTEHVQRHRTLLSEMQPMPEQNTSMAIETEEEREMINESSDLKFLEVLGSIGSKVWGFLSNIRQVFAASSASASSASSSSSSS